MTWRLCAHQRHSSVFFILLLYFDCRHDKGTIVSATIILASHNTTTERPGRCIKGSRKEGTQKYWMVNHRPSLDPKCVNVFVVVTMPWPAGELSGPSEVRDHHHYRQASSMSYPSSFGCWGFWSIGRFDLSGRPPPFRQPTRTITEVSGIWWWWSRQR